MKWYKLMKRTRIIEIKIYLVLKGFRTIIGTDI